MAGFVEILLASVEASISVLLTLAYGSLAGRAGMITPGAIKMLNSILTRIFLPLLIITKTGPQLSLDNLARLWVIVVWSILTIGGCHLWGYGAHKLFKMPAWIAPACGLVNANAFPLLMLQSLRTSGLLERLTMGDEDVTDALDRGTSYVLLNSVIQQSIAFLFAPRILEEDREHDVNNEGDVLGDPGQRALPDIEQDAEHVGLLSDYDENGGHTETPHKPILDLDNHLQKYPIVDTPGWASRAVQILGKIFEWLSPPVAGVIIAFTIGASPPLHYAFFSDEGPLKASVTQSMQNLGDLFVSLQMFSLGVLLQEQQSKHGAWPPLWPSLFVLITRFVLLPIISLSAVYFTAGTGLYADDPVLWLVLIIMPSGASALILSSLAQLSDVDVAPISGFLTVSYVLSPLLAITVGVAFSIIDEARQRIA